MRKHLSKDLVLQAIQRFYHYLNSQIVTIEENGKQYSGFLLDISKSKNDRRIGIGSVALGLSIYSLIPDSDKRHMTEMEQCIISRQLPNGSWSVSSLIKYEVSLIYTTCYALRALAMSSATRNATYIEKGVDWLLQVVNGDGGWGLYPDSESHIHSTAEVLYLFSLLDNPIDRRVIRDARDWLIEKRVDSYWVERDGTPSLYYTALAYRGLISYGYIEKGLERTRHWLESNLNKAPCREEDRYSVKIGTRFVQDPISRFTRFVMFEALLSGNSIEICLAIERECKHILNLQNALGFWRCPGDTRDVPAYLNYYTCVGLIKYVSYLDRRPKHIFLTKTSELFKLNPLCFLMVLLFFSIGVAASAKYAITAIGSLGQMLVSINKFFEELSGIANIFSITGVSMVAVLLFLIRYLSQKEKK